MAIIKAPNRDYQGGIADVIFRDGVAETDNPAVIAYCRSAGYEIDGETASPAALPQVEVDSSHTHEQLAAPLRDAAVNPKPDDFLPPVNAGQADPHGPEVVAPGIHAVSGPGPIVPGPVGRLEKTEDGGQVVITDTAEQQRRETTAAEQVFIEQRPVPDVTAELANDTALPDSAEPPAGNASQEAWADWVIGNVEGVDEATVRAAKRDELREQYGPKAE
ncbi:hypothetical protein AB0A95_30875 [Micromonospora sp. NPDC049230]|uniref:hypothetical protein n=1 Tax=Micromonospora sp. NPDC049230 TaxID=3155502 RepID=UPI0033DCEB61